MTSIEAVDVICLLLSIIGLIAAACSPVVVDQFLNSQKGGGRSEQGERGAKK